MSNNDVARQADMLDDVTIASPAHEVTRLRGSYSSQQPIEAATPSLRPPNGDGEPGPGDGPLPPPPPPLVSTPDLALQVAFCLPAHLNDAIVAAVRQAIDPNADVRTACVNQTQHIGIWLRPFVSEIDNQARNRGLQRLNLLGSGETMAFFINSALIRRQALAGWNAAPKRLNGDGNPDPNGPIHLTGFSLSFESPNRVVTRIDGFDERPWPDVDFRLTVTDTLTASGGHVQCSTSRDLDVDTSWLNFLTGLFLIVLPPLGVVFLVERIIVGSADAPNTGAGAGCGAAGLIPQEILIPGGQKVVASYSRVQVSSGGIFAGGSFSVVARTPEVTISGQSQVAVEEGTQTLVRSYLAHTSDLRPPLQFHWSGDGFALQPSAASTGFRFNVAGADVGEVLTRRVAVQVTDADNLVASDDLIVRIHITPSGDDLPPICKSKPWLPQCRERLAKIASERHMEHSPV